MKITRGKEGYVNNKTNVFNFNETLLLREKLKYLINNP